MLGNEPFKRYDVFDEDDIDMYHLRCVGRFGDSYHYQNKDSGVLLYEIKSHIVKLYEVGFSYVRK